MFAVVQQFAVPGDEAKPGRRGAVLERPQVDDLDGRIVLDAPAAVPGRSAQSHFFIIEEEVLVHAAERAEQLSRHQGAGARDPRHDSGPDAPIGLVFPPRAWYEQPAQAAEQAGIDAHRGLTAPIRVPERKADDAGRSVAPRSCAATRSRTLAGRSASTTTSGFNSRIQRPREARQPALTPTANPPLSARRTSRTPQGGSISASGTGPTEALSTTINSQRPSRSSGAVARLRARRATSGQLLKLTTTTDTIGPGAAAAEEREIGGWITQSTFPGSGSIGMTLATRISGSQARIGRW